MIYSYRGYAVDPINGVVFGARGKPIVKTANGYIRVSRKGMESFFCHRAIWISVHGEIPDGMQINHINGIKSDNRICNLEVVTPSENCAHAYKHGLKSAKGEANGRALLTQRQASEIRQLGSECKRPELAERYGVNLWVIRDILLGRRWSEA